MDGSDGLNNNWGSYLKNPDRELFRFFFDEKISNALTYFENATVEAVPVAAGELEVNDENTEKNNAITAKTGNDKNKDDASTVKNVEDDGNDSDSNNQGRRRQQRKRRR